MSLHCRPAAASVSTPTASQYPTQRQWGWEISPRPREKTPKHSALDVAAPRTPLDLDRVSCPWTGLPRGSRSRPPRGRASLSAPCACPQPPVGAGARAPDPLSLAVRLAVSRGLLGRPGAFIIPTGNKSKTGSIALSRRLSLFRQQALKPYKTAMAVMSTVIVLLIAGGVSYGIIDHKNDLKKEEWTKAQIDDAKQQVEQARQELEEANKQIKVIDNKYKNIKKQLEEASAPKAEVTGTTKVTGSKTSNKSIAACEPSVYFVLIRKIVLTFEGQSKTYENIGMGSGFLLNDGRFVTARHVVEPWMFPTDENDEFNLACNAIAHNGGSVVAHLEAYSPTGKTLSFTSKQARINRSADQSQTFEGVTLVTAPLGPTDYAVFNTNQTGGLAFHNRLSTQLEMRTKLTILGYPMGLGANSPSDVHPIYSEASVASNGLEQGLILTTATSFEHGNSGGPVFATTDDGELIVVGLVSAGAGRSTGFVVPISAVK